VFYAAEAAAAPGLPQLDPSFFPSQVFWLAVFFTLLYVLLSQSLLPNLSGVLETRAAKIKSDVDAAASANADAQAALAAYEKARASAKAEAPRMAEVVRAEAAADRSKSVAKTDAQLANRLSAAEQRLAAQRAEGLKAAEEAAGEVAEAIVAKLVGSRA
jgi:F-type H+-transporting ATPase subunit b